MGTTRRRRVVLGLVGLTVAGLVTASMTLPGNAVLGGVDRFASYAPATACDPTAKPGTKELARYLVFTYAGTGSLGISRKCSSGGTSEHKEGRAFDWQVNAKDPLQREQAEDFLRRILATDSAGNKFALARRMGIMYVIWDGRIFALYRPGWRPYTGASEHTDHMHISLTREGGAGSTSFYKWSVGPKLAARTAAATVSVPTDREVTAKFRLVRGQTYRLVATGTYRRSAGGILADAECSQQGSTWRDSPALNPGGRVLDLTINQAGNWKPRTGTKCDPDHVYFWDYTPTRTMPLTLAVRDVVSSNNVGTLKLRVLPKGASIRGVQ